MSTRILKIQIVFQVSVQYLGFDQQIRRAQEPTAKRSSSPCCGVAGLELEIEGQEIWCAR